MDLLPEKNKQYRDQSYWDWRYERDTGVYEWFKSYKDVRPYLIDAIPKNSKVLHVGCGNSTLTEDIYDDYKGDIDIYNIDFSSLVIETMKHRNEETRPNMKWLLMDATDLSFDDGNFDIVLEKGTFDAILAEQDSAWEVTESVATMSDQYLSEISRVLKKNGKFIYITFGQPHFRKPLLMKEKYSWDLETITFGDGFHYFIYIMTKK